MAATIKRSPRGGLYRDSLRPWAWGRRVGSSNEGHAILVREDEVYVVPVARLRRINKPRPERTLKEKRNGWSRGEKAEMNWFCGAE